MSDTPYTATAAYRVHYLDERHGRIVLSSALPAGYTSEAAAVRAANVPEIGALVEDARTGRWSYGHGWHSTASRALAACGVLTA